MVFNLRFCGDPRMKEQIKARSVLECRNRKTRPLSSFPPPCCNFQWISGPPEQCTCLPSYPIGRRYFLYSFLYPVYVPHPISKWPARPHPTPCTLGIKVEEGPLFTVGSPLSCPAVIKASPTLIKLVSVSFCLTSGSSFPTCSRTTTVSLMTNDEHFFTCLSTS